MHRYKIFLKTGETVEVEAESVKPILDESGYVYRHDFVAYDHEYITLPVAMFNTKEITGWAELPEEARPQPETGHWIMHQDHRECSKCGIYLLKDMPRNSYCPNCGTRMTESEDKSC